MEWLTPEREAGLGGLFRPSVLGRSLLAMGRTLERSWLASGTRRALAAATGAWDGLRVLERLRVTAIAVATAMVVHLLLVFTAARVVEPFALLVPGSVLVLAVIVYAAAGPIARGIEWR